ncbi:molybdopterin synthase [Naegleria gruberi]|uniref:Adenylyltransferase and sulfurtransferase MOCS3 homolog n=1 Tax=Naegleria gruberi TaxID=5762 RepID=D2VIF3_NAEGR|nr:molybdopterin synthase [Naegleria gruberi]EFC43350.1 molybdopterin synthase [Naegleria gruberi]|eukprot:XP_002676094.1 molybdopterin synthase [Naegleria gruberi strain NEG-M]
MNKELTNDQIARFSRHLLLPEIGVKRQSKLCKGSILLVGAGGLGSPAALYLAAAGVGKLGFVDFDVVDSSNLHRQVIHNEHRTGLLKTVSAKMSCQLMNHNVQVECYNTPFSELNGLELVKQYDVVMDCSDNVTTRYLVNDACVLAGKPLVSGSAVKFEGQLTIYNYRRGETKGPCYRCLYPEPPPAATVTSCSDGGVLGIVPGIIGCLQALEAQKLLMEMDDEESVKNNCELLVQKMLLFNAKTCSFRCAKIRGRQVGCKVCGENPVITSLIPEGQSLVCTDKIASTPSDSLQSENRITAKEFEQIILKDSSNSNHILLDVRENIQYNIASVPHAVNFPLKKMEKPETIQAIKDEISKKSSSINDFPIYVMCRRGIASVSATKLLIQNGFTNVKNIDGGINSWRQQVDTNFPLY